MRLLKLVTVFVPSAAVTVWTVTVVDSYGAPRITTAGAGAVAFLFTCYVLYDRPA